VAGVFGFAAAHHRREDLDVRARHVTRPQRRPGGFVLPRQARHAHQLRGARRRDRSPMGEPRPGAERPVERPIGARVPLTHGAHELGLQAFRDLEELDQVIGTRRTRPLATVLGAEVLDRQADLLN
jgi:hypothetical protein